MVTHLNSTAPVFTGEFRHKIEGKNRITVPAAWRFEEKTDLFMIRSGRKPCIVVMPQAELDRLEAKANGMGDEERAEFMDNFYAKLITVPVDKGGRISIPETLIKKFGITDEVVLTGSKTTFKIWNVRDFENTQVESEERGRDLMRRMGI